MTKRTINTIKTMEDFYLKRVRLPEISTITEKQKQVVRDFARRICGSDKFIDFYDDERFLRFFRNYAVLKDFVVTASVDVDDEGDADGWEEISWEEFMEIGEPKNTEFKEPKVIQDANKALDNLNKVLDNLKLKGESLPATKLNKFIKDLNNLTK